MEYIESLDELVEKMGGRIEVYKDHNPIPLIHLLYISYDGMVEVVEEIAALRAQLDEARAVVLAQKGLTEILYAEAMPNLRGQHGVIEEVSATRKAAAAWLAGQEGVGAS